jgi:hypothetical protein
MSSVAREQIRAVENQAPGAAFAGSSDVALLIPYERPESATVDGWNGIPFFVSTL